MNKIAVIDLGSNSVRMVITKVNPDGSYKMIDQVKEMVRLSEGMGDEKVLKKQPMDRTINALCLFTKLIKVHKVKNIHAVATAAVRQADNKQVFLDRIKLETGLDFRVLKGDEEAYYDYLGVINTIEQDNYIMIDIGGASTEIGYIKNKQLIHKVSLPIGAVNLTEKFLSSKDGTNKAIEYVNNCFAKDASWINSIQCDNIIGLGGTIRTIAKIDKKDIDFPLQILHNYQLESSKVKKYILSILDSSITERKNTPGLNKSRADIIGGGLLPLKCLMNKMSSQKLIISGNGLREGIFYEEYLKLLNNNSNILWNVLDHSLENIMKNYETNINHNIHVKNLALELFDQLSPLHNLNYEKRKILEVSSLLHSIGMHIDYYNFHKHTFYLILNSRIYGLNFKQLVMCAFVASMHRPQNQLKEDWREYSQIISQEDYDNIKILRTFLMIADKLDRNEYGVVEDLTCSIKENVVNIYIKTAGHSDLEIAAAMKSDIVFYKQFNKKLEIVNMG